MAGRSRRVIWTDGARRGLDQVLEYIAEDSPVASGRFLELVLDTTQSLTSLADRGRIVPEIQRQEIREVFVYRYRMLYQLTQSEVYIIGFLHGARDLRGWMI